MFTGHPSSGHEHFSAVPHVPSAFSMFGHPGYPALRPTGTEFGGLGNLHSLTEAARLQALGIPTSMAGHNPLSPSTDPGTNPWWQHAAAAHSMAGLGHEFYASSLGAAGSPTFGLAAAAAAAAAAGKEESSSSSPGFESLLGQIKNPKAAKPSPTGSSGSKASTGASRRGRPRKPDSRPSSLSPPATSTSVPASPPPSSLSSPKKEGVSVIKEVPKIIQLKQPPSTISTSTLKQETSSASASSSKQQRSSAVISPSSISTKTIATPTTSLSSPKKKTDRQHAASSDDDDDDDDDIAESDSNPSDVSSGDDLGSDSDPDSDDKELANLMETKKQLEAQQREILHQKAIEMLRKKKYVQSSSPNKHKKSKSELSPLDLLKQKHIQHEQELREQEQKRRAAELTLHFEQQIKEQQQQLRLQKKAQAEREKEEVDKRTSSERYSRKERKHAEKKSRDQTSTPLDMSKKPRKSPPEDDDDDDEDDQPLALNLKINKKLLKSESSHAQVNGKSETASSAAVSPAPSYKSNATDTGLLARFKDVDSEADSEKATEDKAVESEEDDEDDSDDDDEEESSDSDGDEEEDEEEEEDSDEDHESKADTDADSEARDSEARDSEGSPVPNRILLSKRQLIESMIEVPDTNPRKRMRVTDEESVRHPLDHGWRRQVVIRQLGPGDRVKGDVIYYAPCGKKLRTYPEVMRYIERRGITTVAREHFSYSAKIRVGEFLNPKPGENGIVFEKLTEEELQNRIDILCNRKPRSARSHKAAERKRITQELARRAAMVKQQKKLEQQEMARRITEAKMRRKMERQAHLQAQREARRQQAQLQVHLQALQMAEAKKREKDHRRMLKDQQKIARMQQLRLEREMRNHQIIEEREIRRQQAVLMKHQERERRKHLLILERERRKQHMMLVRALEARKKAEEKERAKQHKKADKKMMREKKFQQQQMELHMARELKKPVEDMKLHEEDRPLPELERMKNVHMSGSSYANCLMVTEFLHNFGETLGLDEDDIPTMGVLQAGISNEQDHIDEVITLTVQLLSMAVDDPGLPGELNNTSFGEKLDDVIVTENNMSEILRLFMMRTNGKEDELSETLIRLPYRALSGDQKASVLAFLVNQLVCNQTVMKQIDVEMNKVADLRRDKWVVEGKLRKLRVLQSKKFGRKSTPKKNSSTPGTSTPKSDQSKSNLDKTPGTPAGLDDDDDDTKDVDDDDEEEEPEEGGGGEEEEEEEDDGITLDEIQKKIERLQKQHGQFRQKIFNASHSTRATTFGQDRFKRRYWVLPHAGGIYVEGMESAEPPEVPKKEIKSEVKMEIKSEKEEVKTEEEEKEETMKEEKEECEKEECKSESKDSKKEPPPTESDGSSSATQNGDQTASTSQEVSLQSENNLFRTVPFDRTMDKDEIERKFERDLEGLIERGLSADDNTRSETGTKSDEHECSMEKKDTDQQNDEEKMDVAETETKATQNGPIVQNGPTDLSKHGARRTPTPTTARDELMDKDKQGHEQDKPLSLEPKREVSTPTLSKASTPTPSKVSTPSHVSTPSSSTRGDVSSPSLSDSAKSGFMSLDSILHRGTPQPYVLANPYAAATSAASPVISDHLLGKGSDSKPNGSLGTWFSILPRMPCDDESLTRTKTSNDNGSSDQQIPAELKHATAAMPFNVSPYGLYQIPFPLMHMNQMNPLVGAYAAFPGFGAVPLQAVPGMNGPLDLSNPMMPVATSSSPQQDVKPDIKVEVKRELEEDEDDDRESIAIANMKVMLDRIESAVEKPIPEDLRDGWWQITSMDQLRVLMRSFQPRGIRERILQKTLQKYVDFCEKSINKGISEYVQIEDKEDKDNDAPDSSSANKKEVKHEINVKDILFCSNKRIVETIEEMEEKVYCASMQVKGWTLPDKVTGEPFFQSLEAAESSGNNLLNIAIRRLEALEKAVERRYLKPPLTRSSPNPDDVAPGLVRWRNAVAACTSASQICLCLGMLENCIAWDKSIMKVFCQLCRKGDNEGLLLLCDGCDKGFHTYCFKPKMENIPEGDWYCSVCVSKATGEPGTCTECQKTGKLLKCCQCPRSYHLNCLNPQLSKMPRGKWLCPPCEKIKRKAEKKKKKKSKSKHKDKSEKAESGRSTPASVPGSPADTPKSESKHVSKKHKDDMAPCKQMISELDKDDNSWPFLLPVNTKQFTSYRKIIKKPMDLSTLRNKMHNGSCRTHEDFAADVRLVFDNCETYNEDESEVGQAGHALRALFEKRWPQVLKEHGYLVPT